LLESIISDLPFKSGYEVALMVNGLGGTPISELYIACSIAYDILKANGIKVFKTYVNNYCTSLDMEGCSISLLNLNEEFKRLLLMPADIPVRYF
jgi:dihydroxyacetone kinase-like protein